MAKKKGWFDSISNKLIAVALSALTGFGATMLSEFWSGAPKGNAPGKAEPTSVPERVIGTLMSFQKAPALMCNLLGTEIREENDRIAIVAVPPGTPGAMLGLTPGDVIVSVDQQEIHTPASLEAALARSRFFFGNAVIVRRGAATLQGEVQPNPEKGLVVRRPLAPR